jgi:TonB family protein
MKQCSTCQEEFADKFSFCPVDGTPLNGFAARQADTPSAVPADSDSEETVPSTPAVQEGYRFNASDNEDEVEAEIPESVGAAAAAAADDGEYHLTIMDDAGLVSRLTAELREVAHESQLTWPEFKRDPFGFTKRSFKAYGKMAGGFFSRPNVAIALMTALVSMIVLAIGIAWIEKSQSAGVSKFGIGLFAALALGLLVALFVGWFTRGRAASLKGQTSTSGEYASETDMPTVMTAMAAALIFALFIAGAFVILDRRNKQYRAGLDKQREDLEYQGMVDIPAEQEEPEKGTAGNNKGTGGGSKPKQEKPGGGGGGGREDQRPASQGKLPQASLTIPQVLAPNPNPPPIKNPSLPVAATIDADPLLFPPDTRPIPYGDPKSRSTELSSGPGTGNGIGTGTGGGVGSGEGGGVGPGRGGNTGGGDRNEGGGGPGGGGGGGPDPNKIYKPGEVTTKARITSKPTPEYTEEARKNQVTGTVVLQMVLSSSGGVTNIRTVSGLPFGLTEKAIAAARRIQFTPATKEGRPVSQYIRVEYNFNIY